MDWFASGSAAAETAFDEAGEPVAPELVPDAVPLLEEGRMLPTDAMCIQSFSEMYWKFFQGLPPNRAVAFAGGSAAPEESPRRSDHPLETVPPGLLNSRVAELFVVSGVQNSVRK